MAKLKLKGFFAQISEEKTVGENNVRVQDILFRVPGFTDEFGDKKSQDEFWPLGVMGSKIDDLKLYEKQNDKTFTGKASVDVYVNSKTWYKKEDTAKTEPQYSLYAVLYDVEYLV